MKNALRVWKLIYVRESTFSAMKQVKSKHKNQMADYTLNNRLQPAVININIDIQVILSNKKKPRPQKFF